MMILKKYHSVQRVCFSDRLRVPAPALGAVVKSGRRRLPFGQSQLGKKRVK